MKILVATTNKSKSDRIEKALTGLDFEIQNLNDLDWSLEIDEDKDTFEKNAVKKALEYSKKFDGLVIASDGGFSIPVLGNNWNALFTHRFAGKKADDFDRINAVLEMMKPYKGDQRASYFTESIAIERNNKVLFSTTVKGPTGYLLEEFDKANYRDGFWMGAIFYFPEFDKVSNLLTDEERAKQKNHWSLIQEEIRKFFSGFLPEFIPHSDAGQE